MSGDGKTHKGFLLTSGWWGVARHVNYMGDLLLVSFIFYRLSVLFWYTVYAGLNKYQGSSFRLYT